jgi:hypothetical protein
MKAQFFSYDFMIGVFLIVLASGFWFWSWERYIVETRRRRTWQEMELVASDLSDLIIRIPGVPANWNSSNVEVIGLADEPQVLNSSKLAEFAKLSYADVTSIWGIPYNFHFNLTYPNGTLIQEKGLVPAGDYASVSKRIALLNQSEVFVYVTLWI